MAYVEVIKFLACLLFFFFFLSFLFNLCVWIEYFKNQKTFINKFNNLFIFDNFFLPKLFLVYKRTKLKLSFLNILILLLLLPLYTLLYFYLLKLNSVFIVKFSALPIIYVFVLSLGEIIFFTPFLIYGFYLAIKFLFNLFFYLSIKGTNFVNYSNQYFNSQIHLNKKNNPIASYKS